jgi:hypothetical protein
MIRLNVGTKAEKGLRLFQPSVTDTHMLRFEQGQFQCTAFSSMSAIEGPAEHRVRRLSDTTMTGNFQNFEHLARKNKSRLESDTVESVEYSIMNIKPEHTRPNAVPRLKPRSSIITIRLTQHRIKEVAHTHTKRNLLVKHFYVCVGDWRLLADVRERRKRSTTLRERRRAWPAAGKAARTLQHPPSQPKTLRRHKHQRRHRPIGGSKEDEPSGVVKPKIFRLTE